jgi:FecR-like protein
MRRRLWFFAIVVSCLTLSARADNVPPPTQPAAAAIGADIGRSIVVVNNVDGQLGDTPAKHIQVNDDIVFQEDITTGDDAKAVIEFRDGSTFELGPNAAVRIDSFIFNPEESTSHKALQVARGVFRYVSGYVSSDQNTQITTPAGAMTIRGSVAEGIVDPSVPDFVYLGQGNATFTNSVGSSTLEPGNSIAVPSTTTQPMAASAMPAPVAAQALQAIENRLPPRADLANQSPADEAWLKRTGTADLVPVAEQQRQQAAAIARPLPAASGSGRLAGELSLLTEANRLNLFNGRQTTRTPEQQAFLARAAREHPDAPTLLRRFDAQSRTLHSATMDRGTTFVLRGVGHAAPSADVMRRVTAASVHANPGAAGSIQRGASEAYRGSGRSELNRPAAQRPAVRQPNAFERNQPEERPAERTGNARPGPQRPFVRQPNAFEHEQPGQNAHPPVGHQQQAHPPQQQQHPAKPPPKKAAPEKKKDDQQH